MLRRLLVAIPAAFLFALFAASVVSAHEGHDHSLLTADAGQELRGRVVETHGDTMTGEAKGRTFWLETGAERIRLVGAPDSLRPGERVRVRGTRKGESFLVAADPGAVTADGPASVASVGPAVTKTVAVIAFTFSDNTSQPWTTDQIRANFFATSNSVRSYFSDASYGQVTVTGDVFGWYQIAANDDACNTSTWGTQAKAAATAAGVNLGAYQHIVFIFPRSAACGWAGLAYMPGTESWNNGTLSVRVAGHELAHNFGVHHASTLACTSAGVPVTLSTSCTESEYGDPFDIMGSAARLTNNWHRWRLGYFSNSEVVTVTSANAGQLTLGVVSQANSVPKIVRVARGDGNFYYLEFRQPFGSFDNFAVGDSAVNGVLVRVAPDRTNVRPLPARRAPGDDDLRSMRRSGPARHSRIRRAGSRSGWSRCRRAEQSSTCRSVAGRARRRRRHRVPRQRRRPVRRRPQPDAESRRRHRIPRRRRTRRPRQTPRRHLRRRRPTRPRRPRRATWRRPSRARP